MKHRFTAFVVIIAGVALFSLLAGRTRIENMTAVPLFAQGQLPEYEIKITGNTGARKRIAVPLFSAEGGTPDIALAARTMSDVLWNDLDFEGEFYLIPAAEAAKVPAATSID